jgi:hypothetical protein
LTGCHADRGLAQSQILFQDIKGTGSGLQVQVNQYLTDNPAETEILTGSATCFHQLHSGGCYALCCIHFYTFRNYRKFKNNKP